MRAENPVFFLDYDGTLAPIAQRPEEAFPHPEAPGSSGPSWSATPSTWSREEG